MIILGIDPGMAATGYGVIKNGKDTAGRQKALKCLGYGVIQTPSILPTPERLKKISQKLARIISEFRPHVLAVENIFFFKNLKTAVPVLEAKGVIILTAARKKIPVYEFSPLAVKMVTTGYGRATKTQIQKMMQILLNLPDVPEPDDAADALAIALCCAKHLQKMKLTPTPN